MSVTIDDDRRLPEIANGLREFAEVNIEPSMAILCAVGENLRIDPAFAIRMLAGLDGVSLRMVSQAASRRNITVVIRDTDLPIAMSRLHNAWFAAPSAHAAVEAARGVGGGGVGCLPVASGPLSEIGAEVHAAWPVRLFAS